VADFEGIDGIFLGVGEVICINFIESSLSIIKLSIYFIYYMQNMHIIHNMHNINNIHIIHIIDFICNF
jgi:hypothetical protein